MSGESWALVGVAVGALLGGLAQLANGYVQDARARRRDLRVERRAAYVELLAARQNVLGYLEPRAPHDERARDPGGPSWNEGTATAFERLGTAVATVRLVAPTSTWAAAEVLQRELTSWTRFYAGQDPLATGSPVQQATDQFVALARDDLGTTPRRE